MIRDEQRDAGSLKKVEHKKIVQISLAMTDPKIPGPEEEASRIAVLKSMKSTLKEEEEMEMLLKNIRALLAQKPTWVKASIEVELQNKGVKYSSDFTLKKALSTLTYLFKNGPWKFTYIRFGYDPRTDKKSFAYQTFNVGIGNKNFLNDLKAEPG